LELAEGGQSAGAEGAGLAKKVVPGREGGREEGREGGRERGTSVKRVKEGGREGGRE